MFGKCNRVWSDAYVPTRGASFVTEYNPKTGDVRQWIESYNHSGNVIRGVSTEFGKNSTLRNLVEYL